MSEVKFEKKIKTDSGEEKFLFSKQGVYFSLTKEQMRQMKKFIDFFLEDK